MSETHPELPFAEDFSARVLAAADLRIARRRRLRWAAAAASVLVLGGTLTVWAIWRNVPGPADHVVPAMIAATGGEDEDFSARQAQTEPLDFMFPDAAPLARFSERYSGSYGGTRTEAVFTGDLEDDTGS